MRVSRDNLAKWAAGDRGDGLSQLIADRDYEGLNQQDQQLRLWLPEPAKLALEEIAEIEGVSMTAYLIEFFTAYLYGRHELLRMRATKTGIYEPNMTKKSMMGVRHEVAPSLGKNIFPLKIFLPEKLKAGISTIAAEAGMSLGELCRMLICGHFFGQEYGLSILAKTSNSEFDFASDWEDSDCD